MSSIFKVGSTGYFRKQFPSEEIFDGKGSI